MTQRENMRLGAGCKTAASRWERGFTMIELMIVIVIVSVLVTVAAPGFRDLIGNNRMISELYTLRATLNQARSEALARRAPVVVCPTTDGSACVDSDDWSTGYMAFVDTDGNGVPEPNDPAEEIIQREGGGSSVEMAFNNGSRLVRFGAQGTALGFEGTFTLCDQRGPTKARALIVNPVGTVRAATDTDTPEDYIVDHAGSANVSCN